MWFFPVVSGPFLLDAYSSVTSDMVRMGSAQWAETDSRLTMRGVMVNYVPTGRTVRRGWRTVLAILVARHYVTGEDDELLSDFLSAFNRYNSEELRIRRGSQELRCVAVYYKTPLHSY